MGLIEAKRYGEALLVFETFLRVRIIYAGFPLCLEGYLRVLSELAGCGINAKHSSHPSLFLEFPMLANTFSNISWKGNVFAPNARPLDLDEFQPPARMGRGGGGWCTVM